MTTGIKKQKLAQLTKKRRACNCCQNLCREPDWMYNPGRDTAQGKALDAVQIGPWTDWNGNPDAEYLIVGQDWGTKDYLKRFRKEQERLPYEVKNPTNRHLADCVRQLNSKWDILKEEGAEDCCRYPLYFTNEILCFKNTRHMAAPIPAACYQMCGRRFRTLWGHCFPFFRRG